MSGTRFARSGRCRFFVCLGVMVLMFGIIAIFHSSQQQLDKSREQHIRCEQQQEALNEQLQSVVEDKYKMKKTHESEISEQLQSYKALELKMKELKEQFEKNDAEERTRYEKLQQTHKNLQSKHTDLIGEYNKSKAQQLEERSGLERKLKIMREDLEKEKSLREQEIKALRLNYDAIVKEKDRLEGLLNAADSNTQSHARIHELENLVLEYKTHCIYEPVKSDKVPLKAPEAVPHSYKGPRVHKSFNKEEVVSPGFYRIPTRITNITKKVNTMLTTNHTKSAQANNLVDRINYGDGDSDGNKDGSDVPFKNDRTAEEANWPTAFGHDQSNRSLILNSVENFQILPKPIKMVVGDIEPHEGESVQAQPENTGARPVLPMNVPRKVTSTEASKSNQKKALSQAIEHLKPAINMHTSSSSTSSLPPLQQPPNQRKLPENVAPIPDNFNELLQQHDSEKVPEGGDAAENNAAEVDIQKNDANDDGNNNRYANVVNDMANKEHKPEGNDDSGAHEVKDQDFMNDQNFNLPPEDDNFFDGGKNDDLAGVDGVGGNVEKQKQHDDSDDDIVGGGDDLAVKNHNQMLDDNLNNEVAGDQGKELPDGLQIGEGMDGDDDDYSHPAARQQGAQAIRN